MRVVAIANQKGGVGKTTTAVNLSAALAARQTRVLLIDLDPQGNATSSFGLHGLEGQSIYGALLGDDPVTAKVLPTRIEKLFIIPADLDLAGAEIEIARMDDHLTRLAQALRILREDETFDYVLLDCPPSLGILMTNALGCCRRTLHPDPVRIFCARRSGQDRSADRSHSRFRHQPPTRVGRNPDDDVRSPNESRARRWSRKCASTSANRFMRQSSRGPCG